jgi:hypothetical protein
MSILAYEAHARSILLKRIEVMLINVSNYILQFYLESQWHRIDHLKESPPGQEISVT